MGFRNRLNFPPGSITAAMLADGSVTGPKLSFDAIDGKTITGAFIRTAATGKRWEIDSPLFADEIRGYTDDPAEVEPALIQVTATELIITSPDRGNGASFIELDSLGTTNTIQATAKDGVFLRGDYPALANQIWVSGADGAVMWAKAGANQIYADAAGAALDTTSGTDPIRFLAGTGGILTNASIQRDTGWTALARVNSWIDFAGARAGYLRDAAGNVHVRGVVGSGTAALIATLPAGYRPTQGKEIVLRGQSGASSVMCVVTVDTAGAITVVTNLAAAQVRLGIDFVFSLL